MEKIFKAGYNRQTVNPEESIPLTGFSNEPQRFHTAITEDICVTCVALNDGENTVLMMGTDMCVAHSNIAEPARERISKLTGVPEDRIYITGTHTHSAPGVGWEEEYPAVARYNVKFLAAMEKAAELAIADLQPARMFTGSIETQNLNFVKHYKMTDIVTGEVSYIGDCFGTQKGKWFRSHATNADPTLHLLKLSREGAKDIVITNFRAHPHFTGGAKRYDLSSDYIGAFRMALEAMQECDVVYFQGAAGNINSSTRMPAERRYTTCRSYGMGLAAYAVECLGRHMTEVEPGPIRTSQFEFYGEINHSMDHLKEEAEKIRRKFDQDFDYDDAYKQGAKFGIRSPFHAGAIMWNAERTKEKDGKMILNAVSVGDNFAFVTFPGEMFDSISVRMEENSPFPMTMMLGYCHHHIGYLPSAVAYKYTSYETDITRFQAGTGEAVADTYVEMLEELRKGEK